MNLWNRLRGQPPASQAPIAASTEAVPSPAGQESMSLIMLFDTLPRLEQPVIERGLHVSGGVGQAVQLSAEFVENGNLHAIVGFGEHRLRLVGFDLPAPGSAVEQAIDCAPWPQGAKQPLRSHRAHVLVAYLDGSADPTEQLIAVLRLAATFGDSGLLGVVDSAAWNCIPAHALGDIARPDMLDVCRRALPVGICTGFVKFFKGQDEVWFCSKGLHRWGVGDFALLGKLSQAQETSELFGALFDYVRESRPVLRPGHTAQFGNLQLRFDRVTEYAEFLQGPLGTLVVSRHD